MNPSEQLLKLLNEQSLWESQTVVKRNEYLSVKGDINRNLYYINSGSMRAYVIDNDIEHTIRLAYSGDFFLSLDSFLSSLPSNLYLQAIKKCEVKSISKAAFDQLIQSVPEHQLLWNRALELLVYQQLEREQDLLVSTPHGRYHRVWSRSPRLFQEIPNKHIASYLRMTPETLSRIKKSLD